MKKEVSKSNVTPWEVSGKINYERLVKDFGVSSMPTNLIAKTKNLHPLLRRGFYFSHRDFDSWVKDAESKKKVSILTGRGPSEKMHVGHLVPFLIAKSLQDKYKCNVYIPFSEDEKYFVKKDLGFEEAKKFTEENISHIIALGFDMKKTFFSRDFNDPELYSNSAKIAKLITYSEVKAIFGLKPENNIGWSFYPAVQAYHILLPQLKKGPHKTLVPVGIDQDPFIRLTRDIATHSSLKLNKPSAIYSKFLPGLRGGSKMSSSSGLETDLIFLTDTQNEVKRKINKYAFSGGKDTLEAHRKHGGNPEIDVSFQYLKAIFETDDKKLSKIEKNYRSGKLTTGELKAYTIEKINFFLKEHQKKLTKARKDAKKIFS